MAELSSFAIRLCVMAVLLGAFETLVPAGGMQRTAHAGFGLAFISYAIVEIVGILGRMGV